MNSTMVIAVVLIAVGVIALAYQGITYTTREKVLAVMNSIHAFISGENFFCPMVKVDRERYIALVKETLKFIHIPAFTQNEAK